MRYLHSLTCFIFVLASGLSATFAQRVDFRDLDRFFGDEPKIEVSLKGALLRMGVKAAEQDDPEAAEMLRNIRGIYVRGYPLTEKTPQEARRKMTDLSRSLTDDGWDVITRVRDEESSVYVMTKETSGDLVDGMLIMVLDMEGDDDDGPMAMFVNIDGKVDPDRIGQVTGNLHINGVDFFSSKPKTPKPPKAPRAPRAYGGVDGETCGNPESDWFADCVEAFALQKAVENMRCPAEGKPGAKDCERERHRIMQEWKQKEKNYKTKLKQRPNEDPEEKEDDKDQNLNWVEDWELGDDLAVSFEVFEHPLVQKAFAQLNLSHLLDQSFSWPDQFHLTELNWGLKGLDRLPDLETLHVPLSSKGISLPEIDLPATVQLHLLKQRTQQLESLRRIMPKVQAMPTPVPAVAPCPTPKS